MTNLFDMGGDGVEEYAIGAFGTVSSTPSTGAVIVSLRRRFGQPVKYQREPVCLNQRRRSSKRVGLSLAAERLFACNTISDGKLG